MLLARGADPARRDRTGSTPLESAARSRHAEVVDLLLKPGSAAVAQAGQLLIEAAIKGQTDIADLLISKGAQVDSRDKTGATALHHAALKGNVALSRLLLDRAPQWMPAMAMARPRCTMPP